MRYQEIIESAREHGLNKLDIKPDDPRYNLYTKVINQYTGADSRTIANTLHNMYRNRKFKPDQFTKEQIQMLDDVMYNHPLKTNLTVYHGLRETPLRIWFNYKVPLNKSVIVHMPAFTSTSTDTRKAQSFARADYDMYARLEILGNQKLKVLGSKYNVLKIPVPAGTPGLSVKNHSNFKHEDEILLGRGVNLQINPNPKIKGVIAYWDCKVLSVSPVEHFEESVEVNEESEFQFIRAI